MPATRNIPARRSRRLSKQSPPSYNEDGWEQFAFPDSPQPGCVSPNMVLRYPSPSPVSPLISEPDDTSVRTTLPRPTQLPTRRGSHSRKRAPDHIPRPPNAFMMFRSHYCVKIKNESSPENNHAVISKQAGEVWRSMSDAEKSDFHRLAYVEKMLHASRYPDYKYAPNFKKAAPPKRRPSKRKDEEDRCIKVASLVRQGLVGNELASAMVTTDEPDRDGAVSTPPQLPVLIQMSPEPIKEESPAIELSNLAQPTDDWVPTEDIPHLDLNESMSQLTFEEFDSILPVELYTAEDAPGFKPLPYPLSYFGTQSSAFDILPHWSNPFSQAFQPVETFYNYDARADTTGHAPAFGGDWSHTALRARAPSPEPVKVKRETPAPKQHQLEAGEPSTQRALTPPPVPYSPITPPVTSFGEKLEELGAAFDNGYNFADFFSSNDEAPVNYNDNDWFVEDATNL
ncbi:hypothetical protein EYR40_004369 [Pleurotus pulmonarius]|nr:hypothetical protein EYR40_004369 [Pleurotus pulmonarius]KAF4607073.1 hypothetical protein EYR38_001130 [Pleurotus pulmonarius]